MTKELTSLTTIASFATPMEAHIVRGRLASEGIQAFVQHENFSWAHPHLADSLGGVRLQVATDDAQRATEILEET